jgi:hypothetical protein
MSFQNLVTLSQINFFFPCLIMTMSTVKKNEQKIINNVIQHDFTTVLQWSIFIASENDIDDQNLLLATVH